MVKVVVMCGGRGARLRPVTDAIPKPLVLLDGKPIVQHLLERYIRRGVRDFILCLGYRGEMVRKHFAKSPLDAHIEYSDAGEEAGILARLAHAKGLMSERVFVAYGDTLVNVDTNAMLKRHLELGVKATITTAAIRSPFGLVQTNGDGRVTTFTEKPVQEYFIGHFLLERQVLDETTANFVALKDGEGLVQLFQYLCSKGELGVFHHSGPQITFNTWQELQQAQRDIADFYTYEEAQQ